MTQKWHSPSTGFSSRHSRSLTLQTTPLVQISKIKTQFQPVLKLEASSWFSFSKRGMLLCAVYISPHYILQRLSYQGMINHSGKDVVALKWTYTEDKFVLPYRINYSCSLLVFCYSNTFSICKNASKYLEKKNLTKYSLASNQANFPHDCESISIICSILNKEVESTRTAATS